MSSAPEPRRTASWAGCQPKSSRPLKRGMKTAGHRWDAWALRQMSETPSRCCVWRKQVLLPARRSTSMVGHPLWIRYSRSKFSGGERLATGSTDINRRAVCSFLDFIGKALLYPAARAAEPAVRRAGAADHQLVAIIADSLVAPSSRRQRIPIQQPSRGPLLGVPGAYHVVLAACDDERAVRVDLCFDIIPAQCHA